MCINFGDIFFLLKKNRIFRVFFLIWYIEYFLFFFLNDIKLNICIGGIFCRILNKMLKNDIFFI